MTPDQFDMFDSFNGPSEQRENIARVYHKIAPTIIEFFDINGLGGEFHVDELRRFVTSRFPNTAPDSPGRIMRDLREHGVIDYDVLNRRKSLYCVTGLANPSTTSRPARQA